MFNKKEYQKKWCLEHKKKCSDCNNLIKFNSTRCKSCETKYRWNNGFNPPHPINSGQFKKGVIPKNGFKKGHIPWITGKTFLRGKDHWNWQGGLTKKNWNIRLSTEYKDWRSAVFKRDNWTCVWCNKKGKIEADHIKPLSIYKESMFNLNNGRTLCHECHLKTDTYGGRARKDRYIYG